MAVDRQRRTVGWWLSLAGASALLAIGGAWATAQHQVDEKLDRETYQRDRAQDAALDSLVVRELRNVQRSQEMLVRFLCQDRPRDLGCQQ